MQRETAQTLAKLFPNQNSEGLFQHGFFFQDQPKGAYTKGAYFFDVWSPAIAGGLNVNNLFAPTRVGYNVARFNHENLDTLQSYPSRQALIESTLRLITVREGWDVSQHNWRGKAGECRLHNATIFEKDESGRQVVKSWGEGASDLEALIDAMIEAKKEVSHE